jgi:hypothetical protein
MRCYKVGVALPGFVLFVPLSRITLRYNAGLATFMLITLFFATEKRITEKDLSCQ